MPFLLLFSVDSRLHTQFTRCSTVSARIIHGHYVDYPWSHVDYLRRTVRLSVAVHAEQPRNSAGIGIVNTGKDKTSPSSKEPLIGQFFCRL